MKSLRRMAVIVVAWAAQPAPAQDQAPQAGQASRGLLELSQQLTHLKELASSRVKVYTHGHGVHLGIYLGDGMVATSHVPDIASGEPATLRCPRGSYRILATGGGSRLKLVSFFKLRDWPRADPEPPITPLADPEWRQKAGDLVCIVGSRGARLALVDESISVRMHGKSRQRRDPAQQSSRSGEPSRFVFGYGITDASSTAGSTVLAADGGLVGMLVRRSWSQDRGLPEKETAAREKPEGSKTERPRVPRRRDIPLILDGRWLVAKAQRYKVRPFENVPRPTLGVWLRNDREAMRMRSRWRRKQDAEPNDLPEAGLTVTRIAVGSPAARAGVRVGDLWVRLGDQPLRHLREVREALAGLGSGEAIRIRFRRGGKLADLQVRPD